MAVASARRPVPAVVFILLLSLLSAIVWYRVLNRTPATAQKASPPTARACAPKPVTGASAGKTAAVAWPRPSAVSLTVLNATQRAGLAKSVAGQLKTRGFKITGKPTNDTVDTETVSQVRYGPGLVTAAKLVQLYLPGSRLAPSASKATSVTVSLGSNFSRLSTNAAVARGKRATAAPVTC